MTKMSFSERVQKRKEKRNHYWLSCFMTFKKLCSLKERVFCHNHY